MEISIGKLRGLQEITDSMGFLTICAADHRGTLQQALGKNSPTGITPSDLTDFKLDLCRAIAGSASAVLLDPQYGAAQAVCGAVLPGHTGLIVSLEASGYSGGSFARISSLLPDWSVKKSKRMEASAVKVLVYFRPDLGDVSKRQLDLVARLAGDCVEEDIPLLVEPVTYPVDGEDPISFAAAKPGLVIETVRQMSKLPLDILKVEFPADLNYETDEAKLLGYCRELDKASTKPWVLLSAGANFDLFKKEVELASRAGASGFLAGRALWQEATSLRSREERKKFFENTAKRRLDEISGVVSKYGKPWYAKCGSVGGEFDSINENWYKIY